MSVSPVFPLPRQRTLPTRKGSVLLITLMVVSLLLLIMVAFSVFVRLELRQVIQHQQLLDARNNAKLSATLALGRLQELTGPDQRITLPAWADSRISASVPPENQNVVGARDSAQFQYVDQGGTTVLQTNESYQAHLGWLISNGEHMDPTLYEPFRVDNGYLQLDTDSALMVGAGSVHPDTDENSNGVPDGFVAAPLENIEQNGQIKGRFAYWVSDEGIKARINSEDRFRGGSTNAWSVAVAQRAAQEWILPGFDIEDPDHMELVSKVYSDPQWELANQVISGAGDESYRYFFHDVTSHSLGMPVNVRRGGLKRDLTAIAEEMVSTGGSLQPGSNQGYLDLMDFVSRRRQTQLDESLLLQASLTHEELDRMLPAYALPLREEQLVGDGEGHQLNTKHKLFPPSTWMAAKNDMGGPTWRQLLTFMTQFERQGYISQGIPSVAAGLHNERNHNLSPVVSRWHVNVGFTMDEQGSDYMLRFHMMPAIALWNPYNVRLETPEYYVRIFLDLNNGDGVPLWFRLRHPGWHAGNPNADDGYWSPVYQFAFRQDEGNRGGFSLLLKLPATVLEPGESRWFELGQHHQLQYSEGRDGNAGGFSFPPFDWREYTEAHSAHGSEYLPRTPGVAKLQAAPGNADHYFQMVEGLSNGGGYSLYMEENLTLRTKIEAGGWRLPERVGEENNWNPLTDYEDTDSWAVPSSSRNMQIRPDVARYWNPYDRGGRWARNNSRIRIHYPTPSFQYRTLDNPTELKTFTFIQDVNTNVDPNPFWKTSQIDDLKVPADRRPDKNAVYNYWLQREEGPYEASWRNRRRFPVRYNESGIIYASPAPSGELDVDAIPSDDLAIELNGITTDWEILEIRTGFVVQRQSGLDRLWNRNGEIRLGRQQGYHWNNFSRDANHGQHVHWGKGRFLMGTDPSSIQHSGSSQDQTTTTELYVTGYFPMFPQGFQANAIELDISPDRQPNQNWDMSLLNPEESPMWNVDLSSPLAPDELGGLIHGLVYSVRMPDHGFLAPRDPHLTIDLPWIAHYNPTSTYFGADALSQSRFQHIGLKSPPSIIGGLSFDPVLLDPSNASYFNDTNALLGHSGYSEAFTRTGRSWAGAVLRDVAVSFEEFSSIGQLMHANLQSLGKLRGSDSDPWEHGKAHIIAKDKDTGFVGDRYPTYAIGGSFAPPDIPDDQTFRVIWSEDQRATADVFHTRFSTEWGNRYSTGLLERDYHSGNDGEGYHTIPMYDVSYWLNDMLWDDFFLTGKSNGRLRWQNGIVDRDLNLSATRVTQEGSFNVNSTRVGAWASLLSGFMDLSIAPLDGRPDEPFTDERIPFSRMTRPFGGGFGSNDHTDSSSAYEGYRRLRPEEIWDRNDPMNPSDDTGLAVEIVKVIKERGPFYSLADFVNRSPLSPNPTHRKMGALQQAIMQSGINQVLDSGDDAGRVVEADFDMSRLGTNGTPYLWGRYWENIFDQLNNSGAPGAILQQDILSKIGGGIQVRSDTFKIRAHGRVTDPTGEHIVSQAWCELTVQRRGEYSEPEISDASDSDGRDGPDELPHELSEINRRFGRRYEIINFRWLAPHEL